MKIVLGAKEIEQAVTLYIERVYCTTLESKIEITAVSGKNYSDPISYTIEAEIKLKVPEEIL